MILAVVVCCLILACVVFEYMRLMIVAQASGILFNPLS